MDIKDNQKTLSVRNAEITESRFSNVKLINSCFDDVNLQQTTFTNANLTGTIFNDVNLTKVAIRNANLTGMTINGILVSDLFSAYESCPKAAVYAKNPDGFPKSDLEPTVEIKDTRKTLSVQNAEITESRFSNAKLVNSCFDDVNLQQTTFTNANLTGTTFDDVNLTKVVIKNANLIGMIINGVVVSDLFRAYESRAKAVIYAKNLGAVQSFYQGLFTLEVEQAQADHVVLVSSALELIILKIPDPIASTIEIADPPKRRSETPIKLIFEVVSISASRMHAHSLGGELDAPEGEWMYQGFRVCDGQDPEGNVIQFRQRELHGAS
jgi:uncharacterized protein YjbI with pentapeptide repeats